MNEIGDIVHVIRVAPDAADTSKRRRMGDDDYTIHDFDDVDIVEENPLELVDVPSTEIGPSNLATSSRVSASSEVLDTPLENHLKSTMLSKEVMGAYLEGESRLRKDLERIGQEDHEWIFKMWDQGGVVVVKLHCVECRHDIGGSKGDHSKSVVYNIFSNFKKSHMSSTSHLKSWCFKKKVDLNEGKQAEIGPKRRPL